MIDVVILGNGNVAVQLAKAIAKSPVCHLIQVYSRSIPNPFFTKNNMDITHHISTLKDASLYIIAISDDAISSFSEQLHLKNKLVVHTSGSVAMSDLNCQANKGVFYPLQSISKQKEISFKNIPICLEATQSKDLELLTKVAKSISDNVYYIDSEQRKSLHVAAVFVNNFTNHLYKIANDICDAHHVDFNILKPLITETVKKIEHLAPQDVQTGPAIREDRNTINEHLKLLTKHQQNIYNLLTDSIIKHKIQ